MAKVRGGALREGVILIWGGFGVARNFVICHSYCLMILQEIIDEERTIY